MFVLGHQLAKRLRDTTRRAADLAFVDVAGRIARTLLTLTDDPGHEVVEGGRVVRISRQELARIVGCSREMAGRVLKSLEEDGIVQVKGRAILVPEDTRQSLGTEG
jgi:CRP/FNR family transcriptional regulator, cyclic AMP receptor protein